MRSAGVLCHRHSDVVNDIEILETNIKDCEEKCQSVNCSTIYVAIKCV